VLFLVCAAHVVVYLDREFHEIFELLSVCGEEVFKFGKSVAGVARFRSYFLSHYRMHAIVESHFKRRYEVQHHAVGMSVVASGDGGFDAPGGRPVTRIRKRDALVDENFNHGLVVLNDRACRHIEVNLAKPSQVFL